jgi:alkanesulfonate monooxygenase SsuD/methylene tetrahydromethanopterin reductase-like flavin-dependent oxidoreductase (luciferase family)
VTKSLSFGAFDHIERSSGAPTVHELYNERLRLLEEYDQAGFYAYHLAQHHTTPLGMAPSPNLFLAAASRHTRQLRLGPLVYLLPFYSPLRLIEEIAMLDHMTNGRLDIGVGRGVSPFEAGIHRIPFYESRDIYEEALTVLVNGLSGERLTYRGRYYSYDNVPIELRPLQQPYPPLWYGSIGRDSTIYAARRGMNFVTIGSTELVRQQVDLYLEVYHESATRPERLNPHVTNPKVGVQRHLVVAETDRQAEAIASRAFQAFFFNLQKLWRDFNTEATVFARDFEVVREEGAFVVGSPSSVRDQLGDLLQRVRCNYLVLPFAWGDLTAAEARRSLDLFASKVMPDPIKQSEAA